MSNDVVHDSARIASITLRNLLENTDLLQMPGSKSLHLLQTAIKVPRHCAKDGGDTKKDANWEESFDATAAFLGPTLWDKSVAYNDDFKMEYMDLDEFFSENGIAVPGDLNGAKQQQQQQQQHNNNNNNHAQHPHQQQQQQQQHPPAHHPSAPHHPPHPADRHPQQQTPQPQHHHPHHQQQQQQQPPHSSPQQHQQESSISSSQSDSSLSSQPPTPPASPFEKPVQIKQALDSVPGQESFDPTHHTFSEEELKPQPMCKKSKKQLVPDDLKDDKYWARRKKNNMAAKRSRDARRVKENQIAMRASFLERENTNLRKEMDVVRQENAALKEKLLKYERC